MQSANVTLTMIEISPTEFQSLVAANASFLTAANAKLLQFRRTGYHIAWAVDMETARAALKTLIPNLPEHFAVEIVQDNPAVALRVRFTT